MAVARRAALQPAASAPVANAGLELDRYLAETIGGENTALKQLYERVSGARPPALYGAAYQRWQTVLREPDRPDAQPYRLSRQFSAAGRLIVGLGGESVRDSGLTLHRLYGVPIIPGSALKGLARRSLLAAAGDADPAVVGHRRVLFGEQESAGYVTFYDAWYIPDSAPDDRPLAIDVITVHHPDYYGGRGGQHGPWDFDDPKPTAFLSARGDFLVAVEAPDRAWAAFALTILERALGEWGVGAKTGSGYGRLTPAATAAPTRTPAAGTGPAAAGPSAPSPPPSPAVEHPLLMTVANLTSRDAGRFRGIYDQARQVTEPQRRAILSALRAKLEQTGLLRRWADRPWIQELLAEVAAERPRAES